MRIPFLMNTAGDNAKAESLKPHSEILSSSYDGAAAHLILLLFFYE